MPAYRSPAEAEIRDAVVAHIRAARPGARIIHEINAGVWAGNRIDVMAVDRAEIISIEVKSEKDKLDRLPAQIEAMRRVSHWCVAALHEKFLVEDARPTNKWAAHYERDGNFWLRRAPNEAEGAAAWIYPQTKRAMTVEGNAYDPLANWKTPPPAITAALPPMAIDMLWAEEMREFCALNGVPVGKRAPRTHMVPHILWSCTGAQITKGVCRALRLRACPEADPIIEDAA
ncbi:MAG: hypothetical protein CMK96_06300 [Pseudomonas sp.]|nr:hypothetical protein [Pseudomonas sp.]QDP67279.1 MAG: hypothetical protein GOVbin7368_70 [Prokaryotic dsDNA virus sp.]|tara:strand:+ start:1490 stop:2179 length:690 start_codon:yes stop_codon:yes gene_type:complete